MSKKVPQVVFKTRVRDESIGGDNPFRWQDVSTDEIFAGKRVVVFALPGAFTPTCSSTHLPGFEEKYEELKALGVDEVYCLSVNDAFTMYQWGQHQGVEKVKLLPDGSGVERLTHIRFHLVDLGLGHDHPPPVPLLDQVALLRPGILHGKGQQLCQQTLQLDLPGNLLGCSENREQIKIGSLQIRTGR